MIFVRWQRVDKVEDAENYIAVEKTNDLLHQEDIELLLEWVDPYFSGSLGTRANRTAVQSAIGNK